MKQKALIISLLLLSCSSSPFGFRDLSDFNLQKDALQHGEEVEILAVSGGPDNNPDLEYYYHYMVVSTSTGDTVNVLVPHLTADVSEDHRIFHYFSDENAATKILHNIDQLKEGGNGNINDLQLKRITRVVVNSEISSLDPRYPTVTGSLGTLTRPDSLNRP